MATKANALLKSIHFSAAEPKGFLPHLRPASAPDKKIKKCITECVQELQQQIILNTDIQQHNAWRAFDGKIITCTAYKNSNKTYELTVVVALEWYSTIIDDFDPKDVVKWVKVK